MVLSRKKNEKIVISGGITISIVEIRGDKVRLGIHAPDDVAVNRGEIADIPGADMQAALESRMARKNAMAAVPVEAPICPKCKSADITTTPGPKAGHLTHACSECGQKFYVRDPDYSEGGESGGG